MKRDKLSSKSFLFFVAMFIFSVLLFSALTHVASALEAAAKANAFSAVSPGAIRAVIPEKLRLVLLGAIAAGGLTWTYVAFETIFRSVHTRAVNQTVVEEMLTIRFRVMFFALSFSVMCAAKIWWRIVGNWKFVHSYGTLAIWSWVLTIVISIIFAFCLTSLTWYFFGDFIHNTANNAVVNAQQEHPELVNSGVPAEGVPDITKL